MNHPIRADKRLGQHFLRDESVIHRLLAAIHPQPGEALLEIGPGLGALTLPLLRETGQLTAEPLQPAPTDAETVDSPVRVFSWFARISRCEISEICTKILF